MKLSIVSLAAATLAMISGPALAAGLCTGFGPQTPRDITATEGANSRVFTLAPPSEKMNLCNIHTHTNAEHRGPGFSRAAQKIMVGDTGAPGFQCNETENLTEAELAPVSGSFKYANPGDTIEVHWVHTSCDVAPGAGLGSCLSAACANPELRVEAQVFLLVNDENALDFADFSYDGNTVDGLHQAKSLPSDTGTPVVFAGSTTGPSFTQAKCSPLQVTWSVRPNCAKLDINSLHRWAEQGNVFEEVKSHGVRPLVTAKELLSPIN